ncbi:MAG: dTDP-4-dehydrorhamnose 3,5-epimerase family protein [Candidatus Hydrogenedentota bacterium]
MITDVIIHPLKVIADSRGRVMHMLRADSSLFKQFGEIYFSVVYPGVIKGWKKHFFMTQHFAVPVGNIKLVIYDDRDDSKSKGKSQEIFIGENNYMIVRIPPMLWYSFGSTDDRFALIANCTDIVHDPKEYITKDISNNDIPYKW